METDRRSAGSDEGLAGPTERPPAGELPAGAYPDADPTSGVVARPPATFRKGDVLEGGYELREIIGAGNMAEIYEAQDLRLGRRVAVKVAKRGIDGPPLGDEARALAAFRHPALVTVHALGTHQGAEFIVMERIYGVTLAEHLARRAQAGSPPTISEVVDLLSRIAEGLAVVHRAGLAHRDIKPDNIMMTPDRRLVLMDFGIVLPEYDVANQVMVVGSPPYMPPESVTNTIEAGRGELVDVYALGVTGYEMLAGRVPYDAETLPELVRLIVEAEPPPLSSLRPDAPQDLCALIHAMMSANPGDRPEGAEAVSWQLEAVRRHLEAAPSPLPERPPEAGLDVLVVEDDDSLAKVLGFYVKKSVGEVRVRRAADGEEALAMLRDRAPELMLLDVHMPRMNGIEVCMYMRGEGLGPATRIIGVSAGVQDTDLALLEQLGMHHFVRKDGDLKTNLERLLGKMFPGRAARAHEGTQPRRSG